MATEVARVPNILIRTADRKDFQELEKILVKFYTSYEYLCVHLKIQENEVKNLVLRRLLQFLDNGVCCVAVVDGKIEGLFAGILLKRNEYPEPDYIYLPENIQVIENLCEKLRDGFWNRMVPSVTKAGLVQYGVVTPKAYKLGVTETLFKEFQNQCRGKGAQALLTSSLTERTAKFAVQLGFVAVNSTLLDQCKDKNGRGYFEGRRDKKAALQVAFLDQTSFSSHSKL